MKMRTRYAPAAREECPVLDCSSELPLTRQEFKDECDLGRILARHARGGVLPQVSGAMYGDFAGVEDYQAAQELLRAARAQFEALPAAVRGRFKNDPAVFLDFVHTEGNEDELVELGLATKKEPPKVTVPPGGVLVGTVDQVAPLAPEGKK